jgi:citrate synthase
MMVCEFRPGLEGIPAAQSSISYVDGQKGLLEYRGIRIEELAAKSTFLETAYLRKNWKDLRMKCASTAE